MKKLALFVVLMIACTLAANTAFAQTMLDTKKYAEIFFGFADGRVNYASQYVLSAPRTERRDFVNLSGDETLVDMPLEFALLSYYSQPVRDIRPAEAAAMLPADNPRLSGQKLGAAVYKELVELRFLEPGNTAAIGRYEAMLTYIQTASNITRADIEQYFRSAIRPFIAGIVDEEFGKISFTIEDRGVDRFYTAKLTRNPQNGQYTLSYERPNVQNSGKELFAPTLDAQLAEMRRNTSDFGQTSIDTVRTQAALIPAMVLTSAALTEVTNIITAFYTNPNQSTFRAVLEAYNVISGAIINTENSKYRHVSDCFARSVDDLNKDFAQRVFRDSRAITTITTLTRDQQQRLIQLR